MKDLRASLRIETNVTGKERVESLKKALMDVGLTADKAEQLASGLAGELGEINTQADQAGGSLFSLDSAIKGLLAGATVGKLADMADQWTGINARLKLVTESQEGYTQAQQDTFRIAQGTRTELDATASLYGTLQRTLKDLGGAQRETADLTQLINQTFRISGAEAGAANGAIRQLAQGLGAGALRGDEFNSVMENSPRLAQAMADGLGIPKGALRALAEEGKLTAGAIVQALLSQKDAIAAEFAQIPNTIGGALQQVENSWLKFIGEIDQARGASAGVAAALTGLAENFQDVADLALIAGEALVAAYAVKGVQAVYAYGAALAKNVAETYTKITADREAMQAAISLAQAEEAAALATLNGARAKAQATVAAIAEAEAHLASVKQLAIYGEARAAAERQVAAAKIANASATEAVVIAERNLQAATTATLAAQAATARGAGVLASTMGLLGGPAGVVALVTGAILLFAQHSETAAQNTEKLNARLDQQAKKLNELSEASLRVYIDELKRLVTEEEAATKKAKSRVETLDKQRGGYGDLNKRMEEYNRAVNAAGEAEERLKTRNAELTAANERLSVVTGKATFVTLDMGAAYQNLANEIRAKAGAEAADNSLKEAGVRLAIEQQRTIYEVAKAKGNGAAATAAKNKIVELEIELAELESKAAIATARATLEEAKAKLAAAEAGGKNVTAEKAAVAAAESGLKVAEIKAKITAELANRARELAKYSDAAAGAIGGMGGAMAGATQDAYGYAESINAANAANERLNATLAARSANMTPDNWEEIFPGWEMLNEEQKKSAAQRYNYGLRKFAEGEDMSSFFEQLKREIKTLADALLRDSGGNWKPLASYGGNDTSSSASSASSTTYRDTSQSPPEVRETRLTINVTGLPNDAENLARVLIPHIERINRLRS